MANETAVAIIRDLLVREVFALTTQALGPPGAQLYASPVVSQFVGLGMARFAGRLEPLTSAPIDELVAVVGTTLQRYLTGEIGSRQQ